MFALRKGTRGARAGATLTFALAAVCSLVSCSGQNQVSPADLLKEARQALRASDFQTVEELVAKLPREAEQWQAGQLLAGEAAFKDGRPLEAVDYYLRAADKDNSTQDGQLALFSAAVDRRMAFRTETGILSSPRLSIIRSRRGAVVVNRSPSVSIRGFVADTHAVKRPFGKCL